MNADHPIDTAASTLLELLRTPELTLVVFLLLLVLLPLAVLLHRGGEFLFRVNPPPPDDR